MAKKTIDLNKHIWEGWKVYDFINELQPTLDELFCQYTIDPHNIYLLKLFTSTNEMRKWVKNNQPYYKKHIPDVSNYFIDRYGVGKKSLKQVISDF